MPRARRLRRNIALVGVAAAAIALLGAAAPKAMDLPSGPPEGPPYRVGGEVTRPVKISGSAPIYTEAARRARIQGVAILEVVIDEHGAVDSPRILKGLPMGLDAAAVEAVKTWKFTPATLQGEAVPVYFILTVNFRLASELDFGPAFSAFLRDHADVRALVEEREYDEAGELIDRWLAERPGDDSLRLGRAYMHLGEDDVEESWRVAQTVTGPEQAEIAQSIAAKVANLLRANPAAPASDRAQTAEVGIAASALAVELTDGGDAELAAHALRMRAELLRLRAALETDSTRQQSLLDEARALDKRAAEIRPSGAVFNP